MVIQTCYQHLKVPREADVAHEVQQKRHDELQGLVRALKSLPIADQANRASVVSSKPFTRLLKSDASLAWCKETQRNRSVTSSP